jgi:two-component system NtrC family response regulator
MADKPIRVLLVDDEKELTDYMQKRLAKKGFAVKAVNCGRDAIQEGEQQLYDVAVVDLRMPEMDGIEVLTGLKDLQPFLQVIMLTGHGSMESALEAGRHDAFRFLVKPYEFDKLVVAIREAHERKRADQKESFQEELNELISSSTSPHDIIAHTRELRDKYEQ